MADSIYSICIHCNLEDNRGFLSLARPQLAESCNPKIACSAILILSVSFGVTDVLVFFLGCPVQLIAHPGCMALGCMAGPCFVHYAAINRTILFSLTFLCVLVHSILIFYYEIKETSEKRIEKTDYWFLLCMFNTTVSDAIPFAINIIRGADIINFGPFISTLNMLGACFDAVVVSKIFETYQLS
ncbi:unnamed protein product [Caenorhabditis nigoni]